MILSTAAVATLTDPKAFMIGAQFAAWIGTAAELGRWQGALGSISKQGDRYLQRLFVLGAIAMVGRRRRGQHAAHT